MKKAPKVNNADLRRARSRMILRGTSLARWSLDNGYVPRSVIAAIRGERVGPRSRAIVAHLRAEGAI